MDCRLSASHPDAAGMADPFLSLNKIRVFRLISRIFDSIVKVKHI